MDINIKFPQFGGFEKIENFFQKHITLIWLIIALALLLYTGYIFYFKIYLIMAQEPTPTVQLQTAQKGQLDQIMSDLKAREEAIRSFDATKSINPFIAR